MLRAAFTSRAAASVSWRTARTYATANLPLTFLTEDEKAFQQAVRKYAETEVKPKVREMDEKNGMDPAILKSMFDNGLMGIEIPTTHGGSGASFTSAILAIEELARIDPAISVVCDVQNTLCNNMFRFYASPKMQEKYYPRLASDTLASFGLSEAGSGSDAFALKTKAVKDGDHYVLNGSKMWITNSGEAGVFIIMANLDPSKGYRGITTFIVDRSTPGFSVEKKEDKMGIRASSTCPLTLVDVRVHKDQILGEIGKGYKYAIEILNEGRIGIGAQMLGLAQGAFDATMPYLFERKQFNTAIGEFQGMQHQYAQIATEIQAARMMVYNAARLKENGAPFVKEAAMAKLYASQVAERTASKCIEWMGGVGFVKSFPVEKFFRDCKIGAIYEGTSNIQLTTIAKLVAKEYQK